MTLLCFFSVLFYEVKIGLILFCKLLFFWMRNCVHVYFVDMIAREDRRIADKQPNNFVNLTFEPKEPVKQLEDSRQRQQEKGRRKEDKMQEYIEALEKRSTSFWKKANMKNYICNQEENTCYRLIRSLNYSCSYLMVQDWTLQDIDIHFNFTCFTVPLPDLTWNWFRMTCFTLFVKKINYIRIISNVFALIHVT